MVPEPDSMVVKLVVSVFGVTVKELVYGRKRL
jgi:hypothetical protein